MILKDRFEMWTRCQGGNNGQEVITWGQTRDYGALNCVFSMRASQMYANESPFQDGAERTWVLFDWEKPSVGEEKNPWCEALTRTRYSGERTGVVLFLN